MRVGDKVRFLNDVGEGSVVKIIDNKTVSILNEFGFEVPVLMKELVVIESKGEQKEEIKKESKEVHEISEEINISDDIVKLPEINFNEVAFDGDIHVYMAFIPKNSERKQFDLFLINDSDFELLYTLSFQDTKKNKLIEANRLEGNTKIHITTIQSEILNNVKGFCFQAIPFINGTYNQKKVIDVYIPFVPVKLFKENIFVENDFFEEDSYIMQVYEESYLKAKVDEISVEQIQKIKEMKEFRENPLQKNMEVKEKKEFENDVEEVDLHIHELIDKVEGLENGEKLQIQLDHFQKKLDEAIVNRKKRIVFIHGVGNGVLKIRLRTILERQYKHLRFQDASFQQYGYGATIVFLRN